MKLMNTKQLFSKKFGDRNEEFRKMFDEFGKNLQKLSD